MSGKHPTWYAIVRFLVKHLYFGTHGGMRSVGQENVPKTGPVLIAPVHLSHLDPPAVACGMRRRLRFMAKEELFHHRLFGKLIFSLGAFPVRRGETDTESIRKAIALLEEGEVLLMFPEGTRGDGESIQEMTRGVAMLAKRTKAAVVPVGIIGTNVVMPRGKSKGDKHLVTLAYGKPFTYEAIATGSNERQNREMFASELQKRIVALCTEHGMPLKIGSSRSD
jgi:1-acyl-sn-glycerol-3-phosphate acyltransferase